jgi:hypothetical protein
MKKLINTIKMIRTRFIIIQYLLDISKFTFLKKRMNIPKIINAITLDKDAKIRFEPVVEKISSSTLVLKTNDKKFPVTMSLIKNM